jgi:hypothetical protein
MGRSRRPLRTAAAMAVAIVIRRLRGFRSTTRSTIWLDAGISSCPCVVALALLVPRSTMVSRLLCLSSLTAPAQGTEWVAALSSVRSLALAFACAVALGGGRCWVAVPEPMVASWCTALGGTVSPFEGCGRCAIARSSGGQDRRRRGGRSTRPVARCWGRRPRGWCWRQDGRWPSGEPGSCGGGWGWSWRLRVDGHLDDLAEQVGQRGSSSSRTDRVQHDGRHLRRQRGRDRPSAADQGSRRRVQPELVTGRAQDRLPCRARPAVPRHLCDERRRLSPAADRQRVVARLVA